MDKRKRLETLLKEDPKDAFLLFAMAKEWEKYDIQISEKFYLQLKTIHPDYLALYYHLGDLYFQNNNFISAQSILQEGLQIAKEQGDKKTEGEIQQLLLSIEMSD